MLEKTSTILSIKQLERLYNQKWKTAVFEIFISRISKLKVAPYITVSKVPLWVDYAIRLASFHELECGENDGSYNYRPMPKFPTIRGISLYTMQF